MSEIRELTIAWRRVIEPESHCTIGHEVAVFTGELPPGEVEKEPIARCIVAGEMSEARRLAIREALLHLVAMAIGIDRTDPRVQMHDDHGRAVVLPTKH